MSSRARRKDPYMRSQKIKIRNVETDKSKLVRTLRVKPTLLLFFILLCGTGIIFLVPYLIILGIGLVMTAGFALIVLPDRILCEFTKDYLILYNHPSRDDCTLVYWEDIVSWQYEYHGACDQLVLILVDGSTERQDVYSKRVLKKYLDMYAPGKEIKTTRMRKR